MTDSLANFLPLLVAVPLLCAAALIVHPKAKLLSRVLLIASPIFSLVYSILLLVAHKTTPAISVQIGGWPAGIAIPFVSDTFAALMLLTTSVLILACAAFSIFSKDSDERYFGPLFLILHSGVAGALLTADLFNLFVFIELMFLPSCGLIVMRKGLNKLAPSRLYVTVNLLASSIFVIGIALVYGVTGTVNLAELAGTAQDSNLVAGAFGVVFIALSVKAGVVPSHGWLTRTYPSTSPVVSSLFSGLHTKIAIVAMFRIYSIVFEGDQKYLIFFTILFITSMVVGALGAVGENNIRSILTFSMVSQIGYCLLGLALFSKSGLAAAIFFLVHNMITKTSLFLSASAIEETYGTGKLSKLNGLAKSNKLAATSFFMASMSLIGFPPFSGFVAKFNLFSEAIEMKSHVIAVFIIFVSIITLIYMLRIWNKAFWGKNSQQTLASSDQIERMVENKKIKFSLITPGFSLALLTLAIGLAPNLLIEITQLASQSLIDIEPYVKVVLNP